MTRKIRKFETIEDAAMEQVKGGLSFSLGFDVSDAGVSLDTPIASVSIPNPITIATDLFSGLAGGFGKLLGTVGNKLTDLGQLFDFS